MKRVLVLVLLLSTVVLGQTPSQPFKVLADHDGLNVAWYTLWVNGVRTQTRNKGAWVNGVVSFDFSSGLQAGTYLFEIEACNDRACSPKVPLIITVQGEAPNAVTNPRVVVQ